MNLDDKSLFLDAMEDVQPLKRGPDIHWQPSRNTRVREEVDNEQLDNFLTLDFLDLLPLEEPLAFQREGVQQGVIAEQGSNARFGGHMQIPQRGTHAPLVGAELIDELLPRIFRMNIQANA